MDIRDILILDGIKFYYIPSQLRRMRLLFAFFFAWKMKIIYRSTLYFHIQRQANELQMFLFQGIRKSYSPERVQIGSYLKALGLTSSFIKHTIRRSI